MSAVHVPVLAAELIGLLDPQPGDIAIDCTFGGGGHARLLAQRLGRAARSSRSTATRSPRSASPSSRARCRARRASSAPRSPTRSRSCATRGYRPTTSTSISGCHRCRWIARARLLLLLRRAAGHAHGPRADAQRARGRQSLGPAQPRADPARLRGGAPAVRSPRRSSAGARCSSTRRRIWSRDLGDPGARALRRRYPAKRSFQALRIAVNDELDRSIAPCRSRGTACAWAECSPACRSTPWRTAASSASSSPARPAASARRTSRSASAVASLRPGC